MKRLTVIMAAMLAMSSLAMQAKDVKGTVIYQADGQPVVGAAVLVKGTTIETLTDVDGRFILNDLPDDAKKLQISFIGMQTRTVSIKDESEVMVKLRREERIVTPFVKAGISASRPQSDDNNSNSACMGFTAGAGVSFALSHSLSLTPAIMFMQKPGKWEIDGFIDENGNLSYSETSTHETNPLYLSIPVMFDVKLWTKKSNKIVLSVGPYVAFGLSGKYKVNGTEKSDLFSAANGEEALYKKVDAGLQYGIGGIIRHIYIGVNGQMGLTPINKSETILDGCHNFSADLCIGYYF